MGIAIVIFLVFLLLGMPVAFAIGISGFSFFIIRDLPMTMLVQKSISATQSFTMLAIPLFILAGNLMNATGITKRLMRLANVLTGHMYGNVGQVSCVLSTLMGGVSGSAVADAAMETRILGPEMERLGYAKGWAAAINGLSGLIVATIPPSMGLIIYGTVGEVSIAGGQESYTRVELIPEKLAQYHLNMNTVAQLVGAADFTIPAGDVRVGKQDLDVSVGNEFKSTESLKNVVLPLANGETIHLSDIANVYEALEDANSIGRYNGEDVISLGIKKQQSSTAIEVSNQVTKKVQEIEQQYPGLKITASPSWGSDARHRRQYGDTGKPCHGTAPRQIQRTRLGHQKE